MRLPFLIIFASLILFGSALLSRPLYEQMQQTDVAALSERMEAKVHAAHLALEQKEAELAAARAGLACLAGTGACPGGSRGPFGR